MPVAITNERLRQIVFDAQTNPTQRFIVLALEALLESQVGAGATDDILDTFIPNVPTMQVVLFGNKLGDYSGLSRAQMIATFGLTSGQVDDVYAALGTVSGMATPNPFGASAPDETKPELSESASLESEDLDLVLSKEEPKSDGKKFESKAKTSFTQEKQEKKKDGHK